MTTFRSFLDRLLHWRAPDPPPPPPASPPADPGTDALRGKTVVKFKDFMIAMPQGTPVCAMCGVPTHSESRREGQIVMFEGSRENAKLMMDAGKALLLSTHTSCGKCHKDLCWKCVIVVGIGACPKCGAAIAEHPYHGLSAAEVLNGDQREAVLTTLVRARREGDRADAAQRTARQLAVSGWNEVDAYFGARYAGVTGRLMDEGSIDEKEIWTSMQGKVRRVIEVPVSDGPPMRVIAGTAYVEDTGGISPRVMAEFEDGEIRCVMESMMAEIFVDLINGKGR